MSKNSPFVPGNKLSTGRPKGSKNKRTQNFVEILERENFCPATALIEIYREAKKNYDRYDEIYSQLCDSRAEGERYPDDKQDVYLKIALDAAKDISSYAFPKLKSVEQVKHSPLNDMTPEQKLEALKKLVSMLETSVKNGQ